MEVTKFEKSDVIEKVSLTLIKSDLDDQVLVDSVDLNKSGYDLFKSLDADPSLRESKLTKNGGDYQHYIADDVQHALVDLFQCVKVRSMKEITSFTEMKYLQE